MCGIFGVTNDPNAAQTILEALKRLEYRGYDSWGIAVKGKQKIHLEKYPGKISLSSTKLPISNFGIGHTRWATHGGVSQKNAHPHLDCSHKLAIVHNGIIDNWTELKQTVKRHHLKSETDSEIIAHLIEKELSKHDLFTATRNVFKKLKGLNAIVVFHQDYPYLVAAKNGSPLIIGVNQGNHLISSDVASLLPLTKKVVYLEDGQIAKISSDQINLRSISNNRPLTFKSFEIDWQVEQANKGKYKHFMLKEIFEQASVIKKISQSKRYEVAQLAQIIKKSKGVFTVACGTAAYAALSGQYLFSRIAKIHLNPAIGSEFYYHADFLNKHSLLIALSQSGETIDTIQSIKYAQKKAAQIVSLVNVPSSTISRLSQKTIFLDCGPEKAVASTKAFTAKLTLLLMAAHELNGQSPKAQPELNLAVLALKKIFLPPNLKKIQQISRLLAKSEHLFVLGKGQSFPAALEIALKIKEVSYLHAEGYPSGELKHGPIALIEKGTPCLVLAPKDETYEDIISSAMEVKARGALVIGISPQNNSVFDYWLKADDCQNASIIVNVVVGQLLAYYTALARGLDPDMPRNLAKSVTVK